MKQRIPPMAGQESVWDYPRPPRLEQTTKHLRIVVDDQIIADTNRAYRVLETSHPPVYYIPREDIRMDLLRKRVGQRTYCEFKGKAEYWDIVTDQGERQLAAWSYPEPRTNFARIQNHLAFYASKVDAAYVNDERVQTQEGDFYGGWITSDIVGPFKGGPGTWGW